MAFHDVRFPDNISRGARGGPERRTQIVGLAGGHEERNASWADSRRNYDVSYGIRRADDLHAVVAFFEARLGPLHGFRFKDWADYKSCIPSQQPSPHDQSLGTYAGGAPTFQLVKHYVSGPSAYTRSIVRPVPGSVLVAVDGIPLASSAFDVDSATGVVTINSVPMPGGEVILADFVNDTYAVPGIEVGSTVTAGFEFDVPVRFGADRLDLTLDIERTGSIPSIPLIEIRS